MSLLATIRTLIATSSNIGAPSITISQPGGFVDVLIQVNADDDVRRLAGELEVDAHQIMLPAEITTGRKPVEYVIAEKRVDGLQLRVMGPHHELVRNEKA